MTQQVLHTAPAYRPGIALHQRFWQYQTLPPAFPKPIPKSQTRLVRVVVVGESRDRVDEVMNMINHGAHPPVADITGEDVVSFPVEYLCEGKTYALDVGAMPEPAARGAGMLSLYTDFVLVHVYDAMSEEAFESAQRTVKLVRDKGESGFGVVCLLGIRKSGGERDVGVGRDRVMVRGEIDVFLDCDVRDWSEVSGVFAGIVERLHGRIEGESEAGGVGEDRIGRERRQIMASRCLEALAEAVNGISA